MFGAKSKRRGRIQNGRKQELSTRYKVVSHFSFAALMILLINMRIKTANGLHDYFVPVILGIAALVAIGRR